MTRPGTDRRGGDTRPRSRPERSSRSPRRTGPARPAPTPTVRARRRRWAVAVAVVLVVGAVLGVTLGSPWLDVTRVEVVGAAPETRGAVEQAAAVGPGTSLVWLDGDLTGGAVAERVRALPRVASVEVDRDWPDTLVVTVAEREPVLAVPAAPGSVSLVDATGFAYRTIDRAPAGVPVVRLAPGASPSPGDPSTAAAVRVVSALPADLRRRVTEVVAPGAFAVSLTLTDGIEVRWGAAGDDARKAAVLRALLTREGRVYDVSSPDLPTVR